MLACSITIDGRPLRITQSLDTAIRHLRHDGHSVMIWIDQICINQNDLEEKKDTGSADVSYLSARMECGHLAG